MRLRPDRVAMQDATAQVHSISAIFVIFITNILMLQFKIYYYIALSNDCRWLCYNSYQVAYQR